MQVNRLSFSLQEELQKATNFNTARNETLFDTEKYEKNENGDVDFSQIEIEDLQITDSQIQTLLGAFTDEITKFFGVQPQQQPQAPKPPSGQQKVQNVTNYTA